MAISSNLLAGVITLTLVRLWPTPFAADLSQLNKYEMTNLFLQTLRLPWGCRIHRLLLCRGVRTPPLPMSLDVTINNLMVRFQQCWSFGECGVSLHWQSLPGPLWPGVVPPDKGPIYGLNRINSILMLNWIVWIN